MNSIGLRTGNPIDKRLYSIWRKMHYRCESPAHKHYWNYGGRGIKVCDEWNSFVLFGSWAIAHGYSNELILGRIDINGNYEPSNCQWVTHEMQMNNRRKGEHVMIKQKVKSFSVRQRGSKWEYRIEGKVQNGKRTCVSKCGFLSKEEAVNAAKEYILSSEKS